MTLPLSSSSAPTQLDLATINTVQSVVVESIRNKVCKWEQDALDAAHRGDYSCAQQFKYWAFAAELCASAASSACSAVFMEAMGSLPIVQDHRTVELPNLNRSAEDCRLDDLAIEVASAQSAPF